MIESLNLDLESRTEIPQVKTDPRSQSKDKKKKPTLWDKIFNKNKLKKPNMVAVLFLRNNSNAETMEVESKKGFLSIHGRTYHEDSDCIYRLQGKYPLAVIPEWSLIPFGTKKWHDRDMIEKFSELQDHVLRGIRHAELVKMGESEGKKLTAKQMIGIGLALLIGIIVLVNYI